MTSSGIRFQAFLPLLFACLVAGSASGQVAPYYITTIAGGGTPTGVLATSVGIASSYGVAVDGSGNLYIAATQKNVVYRVSTNGILTTVAGTGSAGYSGDSGPAANARLSGPSGLALDNSGNLYISDTYNYRIRRVSGGIITTYAGNGFYGYSGDGGQATSAWLSYPRGITFDSSGNLYIADSNNNRVRRVGLNGIITTVAGNGGGGFYGDNALATNALLNSPWGVAVDSSNNLFIGDGYNYRVRRVSSGIITSVAGNGTYGFSGDNGPALGAQLSYATGVAVDSQGSLYIADTYNGRVRKLTGGIITTIAGGGEGCTQQTNTVGDGCLAVNAALSYPYGIALDSSGRIYIADNYRIRQIVNGSISTVAGNGTYYYTGDNGLALNAQFDAQGLAVVSPGNYYIADSNDYRVRRVSGGLINTAAGNGTCCSSADTLAIGASLGSNLNVGVDAAGDLFTMETTRVREVSGGIITTIAGNGSFGYGGDNGPATGAMIAAGGPVAVDGSGNVYIADLYNNRVRKVSGGTITTVAGGGPGAGSTATSVSLGFVTSVASDSAGNLYFPSSSTNRVFKMATNGTITPIAGNGSPGFSGDGGTATAAQLNNPYGVAVNSAGTVVYIADRGNNRVRVVAGGIISTVAGGGAGCQGQTNNVGDGCAGTSANLYNPATLALDASGANLYIADSLNYRIRKLSSGVISTVAGNGLCCYGGDGGQATNAYLNYATGIALDNNTGDLYIGDSENFRVRKVSGGIITTIAGNGSFGYSGDSGAATSAELGYPYGVVVDNASNLYIADAGNQRIRRVSSGGIITTVAGAGTAGYSGDGGLATLASINVPYGVALDGAGNLYIADTNNNRIRVVSGGVINTVAGNGLVSFSGDGGLASSSQLNAPSAVAVDGFGNLYIADNGNYRVRKVAGGIITTIAGGPTSCCNLGDGGPATSAYLSQVPALAADNSGNLFLADPSNGRIRKVAGGIITTIAGYGGYGYSGDGGPATNATFANPQGLAVDSIGNIYVADSGNFSIRLLTTSLRTITSLVPTSANVNTSGFTLQVFGSGFISGDVVQWNGTSLITTFVNGGQLTALVNRALIAQAGTAMITVNGVSNVVPFTVNSPVVMVSPADGAAFGSSTVTFQWSAGTASQYGLWIGSTGAGSGNLATTGGTGTSYTAVGLPTDGRPIYVRLWSLVNGVWQYNDYTYSAFAAIPGAMTSPASGTTLPSSTVTFQWTAGTATQYGLWIGSTGAGSSNLLGTGGTSTSYTATGLPTDGRMLYVRLWSYVNGGWQFNDYTYAAYTLIPASMTSPAAGAALSSSTVLFQWAPGTASQYGLWIGSNGAGSANLLATGGTSTFYTATGLPIDGRLLYVRLWSLVNGGWQFNDYTYGAFAAIPATMSSPTNGSTLRSSTVTFQWTTGTATQYGLWIGSTGVGSANLTGTGGTSTSYTATGLPTDGRMLYVRLWSYVNNTWQSNDYTYAAYTLVAGTLTSPPSGSTLTSSSVTFQWAAGNATQFGLWIGSTGVGSANLATPPGGTATSYTATGLPTDGRTINVRLWSLVNGTWLFDDYFYTAYSASATMISPTNFSTLLSSTITFTWTAGGATQYGLWIGTTGVGSSNLGGTGGTSLFYTATGLPTDGRTLYVRLWSLVNGVWQFNDYTYVAS